MFHVKHFQLRPLCGKMEATKGGDRHAYVDDAAAPGD